jgi:DNA polymerase-3 subunit alpha
MRNLMMQMKPTRFENIVAAVALFRPGPMEQIPTYIRRMHGEEETQYRHPDLEPALKETYAIIVYQEQIMRVARDIAGYSVGEADTIRKAVAKKNAEAMAKHKTKFREGAVKKGYSAELADDIFSDIEFFARYGFCKAHAADYAQITCQTAYLKTKYTVEYLTALMTCEAGNTEKIATLVADAKAHGLDVLPPSVNCSVADFSIEDVEEKTDVKSQKPGPIVNRQSSIVKSKIRFGLMAIKNVGQGPVEAIVKARQAGGVFKSLDDFCRRVDMTQVNKRALESLIKVGAFDEFGPRYKLLAVIDQMVGMASQARKAAERGQFMMFDAFGGGSEESLIVFPNNAKEIPRKELLNYERELIGAYVSEHPLSAAMNSLREYITHTSAELSENDHAQKVVLAGVITMVRPHVSKTGKSMAFAELEDLYGRVELTIFPRTWEEYQDKIQRDKVVVVWGKAEVREGNAPKLLVERVSDSLTRAMSADGAPTYAVAAEASYMGESSAPPVNQVREQRTVSYDAPPEPDFAPDGATMANDYDIWAPDGSLLSPPDAPADVAPQADTASPMTQASNVEQPKMESVPQAEPVVALKVAEVPVASREPMPSVAPAMQRVETYGTAVAEPPPTPKVQAAAKPPVRASTDEFQTSLTSFLTVVIRRCGDASQDVARLEAVHQTLLTFKGKQRFSICLRNAGRRDVTLDFPNDTTHDCPELRQKLAQLGADLR